jgi:ribulose-phosphate 3-epimerase
MPMNRPFILPSILAADPLRLEEEIGLCLGQGHDSVHIDVMDGRFVQPISFGEKTVAAVAKRFGIQPDVHLMTCEPERKVRSFADAGSGALSFHAEACVHAHRTLAEIRAAGMKAGISIVPSTPAEALAPVLEGADIVLVMTVNPGWGGQEMIPACLDKVAWLKAERERRSYGYLIYVDGGMNRMTAGAAIERGADVVVAGSAVFGETDRRKAMASLLKTFP